MGLFFDVIGADNGAGAAQWDHRDALLYALGVGAGQSDALGELHLTTENSIGVEQQVLPAFGVVQCMAKAKRPAMGDFHLSKVLHGDQGFVLHQPLPTRGDALAAHVVTGMHDKGSGAIVRSETTLTDVATGAPLMTSSMGLFIRGEGGFGGEPDPVGERPWALPTGDPDAVAAFPVREDLPLLYRLSGDRNPLHSDPVFAQKAGFDRPILHGMATYGIACRVLVNSLCGGDAHRVRSMFGRFSKPVMPGDTLTVRMWIREAGQAQFQVFNGAGDVVLDRGTFEYGDPR